MSKATILKEIIEERRSIFPKDYTDKEIPQEVLEEILHAATLAPNHKRTKPWRFKIFKGEEKAKLAAEMQAIYKATQPEQLFLEKKYNDIGFKINKADVVVSIIVNFSGMVPEWEEIAATSMAVQNMYLTCTANNIGCYWSSPKIVDHLKDSLTIEENQKCLGLFYLGSLS
ncbi:Putative NAD(P)H nitroreductase ydjA [Chryseobacterium gleum]|uniref:NAD(P)H nitroreductase ydjA n=2 Tax=Chryseobacterium gleum TaxID=250 RepID=A0A3S4QWP0_CHRGE|nr:nitroreductase [Chryseobacterium gleum]EFK33010.1 nitroreductase family protein [Chryseobacterium gleum ATCC 35910]QQY33840.1 nitroreductase [Chryseobacterium gleum]VEE07889.1 Putative NAD(P)H nitroreductase ydjA [Chryseobacterium gleum]